jgi:Flp pilus assembly protein TadD
VLAALYALPLLLLIGRSWQLRTRETRGASSELKKAQRDLSAALQAARKDPARESASTLLAALRELATHSGCKPDPQVVERLETEGYKPSAASEPLDDELLKAVADAGKAMARDAKSAGISAVTTAVVVMAVATSAWAADLPQAVESARQSYAEALELGDRDARARKFAAVAAKLQELNREHPERPELLADWGSAALGARDFGHATLAYRRALILDPGLERADANLGWLRANGPAKSGAREETSAADTLFFWHRSLTAAQKHLLAALAFAGALLLLVPWVPRSRWRPTLRWLAIIPALGTVALLSSVAVAGTPEDAVVVVDGSAILRSADSAGAPPVQSQPPGAGAEARVTDDRSGWARLSFGDGTSGWIRREAIEYVVPRR